jgi:nucleoside-diphosphate-sugar epimerase
VIKINDLIHLLENLTGKVAKVENYPVHPADMTTNWADTAKASQLLGWQPQVGLREGVKNLVDWYNQERSWASQVNTD